MSDLEDLIRDMAYEDIHGRMCDLVAGMDGLNRKEAGNFFISVSLSDLWDWVGSTVRSYPFPGLGPVDEDY